MENEVWKDIKDYEGLYQVSNFGRVKRLKYTMPTKIKHNNFITKKEHLMKLSLNKKGYLYVKLCKNGKTKHFQVHRLVACAFIPNLSNKPQVNHLDENPLNNCMDNLEWSTAKENLNYGTRTMRAKIKISKKVNQYTLDNKFIKTWNSMQDIERETHYFASSICLCCKNKRKKAYGYIWKYE